MHTDCCLGGFWAEVTQNSTGLDTVDRSPILSKVSAKQPLKLSCLHGWLSYALAVLCARLPKQAGQKNDPCKLIGQKASGSLLQHSSTALCLSFSPTFP